MVFIAKNGFVNFAAKLTNPIHIVFIFKIKSKYGGLFF